MTRPKRHQPRQRKTPKARLRVAWQPASTTGTGPEDLEAVRAAAADTLAQAWEGRLRSNVRVRAWRLRELPDAKAELLEHFGIIDTIFGTVSEAGPDAWLAIAFATVDVAGFEADLARAGHRALYRRRLEELTVAKLREKTRMTGRPAPSRARKADLVEELLRRWDESAP